jgi:cation:H+ antiporter
VGAGTTALIAAYILGVFITERFERRDSWEAINPPDNPVPSSDRDESYGRMSNCRIYLSFSAASAVILISGWAVAEAADAVAEQTGLSASFIGATLLAFTTSLPELSTTTQAARLGAYGMAISNIFGSTSINTALLFVADIGYREGPILRETADSTIFMAALCILLTCIYLWGLLERDDRSIMRVGWDSAAVICLYFGGMAVLYTLG